LTGETVPDLDLNTATMPDHVGPSGTTCKGAREPGWVTVTLDAARWHCNFCGKILPAPRRTDVNYFVAPDGYDDLYVFRDDPYRPLFPQPVIAQHALPADLWAKLTDGLERRP
jgi:hypothetical protein